MLAALLRRSLPVALVAAAVLPAVAAAAPPIGTVTEFPAPTTSSQNSDMVVGPDGNLWFTNFQTEKVVRLTPDGTTTEFAVPTPNSGPGGIAAGPDGNLWFVEYRANKIGRHQPVVGHDHRVHDPDHELPAVGDRRGAGRQPLVHRVQRRTRSDRSRRAARSPSSRFRPGGPGPTGSRSARTATCGSPSTTRSRSDRSRRPASSPSSPSPRRAHTRRTSRRAADGNLWFTEPDADQVGRSSRPRGRSRSSPSRSAARSRWSITPGPDGNVWFSYLDQAAVGRITPAGRSPTSRFPSGAAGAIGAGPDGRSIWFAEWATDRSASSTPPARKRP